jgi:hypothetical protein
MELRGDLDDGNRWNISWSHDDIEGALVRVTGCVQDRAGHFVCSDGEAEPEAGVDTGEPTPGQLSETVGLKVTMLVQALCALVTMISAGH